MPTDDELKRVAFNLSLQLINHISELLQQADVHFMANDYLKSLDCLISVRLNIHSSLSPIERTSLDVIEKNSQMAIQVSLIEKCKSFGDYTMEIYRKYEDLDISKRMNLNKFMQIALKNYNLRSQVVRYRTRLMELLEKYHYLIKKIEDLKQMF